MRCTIGEAALDYTEYGSGVPLVALHGSGVDHHEIEAALEPLVRDMPLRRIYPDLPGMGRSTAAGMSCNDDVVSALVRFLDRVAGEPVLLLGHSYGAYLARGIAARRAAVVRGLALLCPVAAGTGSVPEHRAVRQQAAAYDELGDSQRAGFDEYFVVRTAATARRYRDHVVPGTARVDTAALARIFSGWTIDLGTDAFGGVALIVAGRCDATAGYAGAIRLAESYPHATLAVLDGSGHALAHERPAALGALIADWVDRAMSG